MVAKFKTCLQWSVVTGKIMRKKFAKFGVAKNGTNFCNEVSSTLNFYFKIFTLN